MDNNNSYVEDMINRYIYQVTKHLSLNSRKDIEQELKSLIYDMLDESTNDMPVTKKDIDLVLLELGNPSELSDKYRENTRCLIGTNLYPQYIIILKIVLISVLFGMMVVSSLEVLTESNLEWYIYLRNWIGNTWVGVFMAFGWVTLIFAIFEWKGVSLKQLMPDWNVSSLPPLPNTNLTINKWEPIVGLIFTVLITLLFSFAPQLMGGFFNTDRLNIVPVFDLVILKRILPLFLICFGIGAVKNVFEMIEGRYTKRLIIFTLFNDVISLIINLIIFTKFNIWNNDFVSEVNAFVNLGSDIPLETIWNIFTTNFIYLLIFAYLLDSGTTLYTKIKYNVSN